VLVTAVLPALGAPGVVADATVRDPAGPPLSEEAAGGVRAARGAAADPWARAAFAAALRHQQAAALYLAALDAAALEVARREEAARTAIWDRLAQCETGGNWSMRGDRYSGGVGFYNGTWDAFGGREFAENAGRATREQQIVVAERVRAFNGGSLVGAWGCGAVAGG